MFRAKSLTIFYWVSVLLLFQFWALRQSQALVPSGNGHFRFRGVSPSPSTPPSEWLEQVLREDEDARPSSYVAETDKKQSSLQVAWRQVRAFAVVQVIRLVLLLHLEGPVLRRLSSKVLFDIAQACVQKEARPRLLRIVATELDRRRQAYELGDISRHFWKQVTHAWKRQFGKEYQFGDITRGLLQRAAQAADSDRWKARLQQELKHLQKREEQGQSKKKAGYTQKKGTE